MALLVMTWDDFEKFKTPLLEEVARIREENAYYRILLKEHQWISRSEAESLLDVSPARLLRNREEWELRYRKGKRFVEYWMPDIWKYLKEVRHLKTDAIEKRIQAAIHSEESLAA
jgi:hypothetical protein